MKKSKLVLTSGIANIFEWYDYALFGHFASIIGTKFFPANDQRAVILQVFLVFAIGYLMRPIGGIIFGVIGDKFGRRSALSLSVMCMAIPTAAIGFLPTYETIGIASTIAMIICRILQGLSMGGALTGSISYIIEHTEKNKRGLYGSIPMASICIGMLLGSLASFLTKNLFSADEFMLWAWRLPFIIGIFIFFAGIYIKNYTSESPVFADTKSRGKIPKSPIKTSITKYWKDILISMLINSTGSIIFYLEAIYLTSYLTVNRGFSENDVSILNNLCYVIMIFFTVLSGYLSDKIGRRKIFVINLIFIITASPAIFNVIESSSYFYVVIAQITVAVIAALYIGAEPALQAELYPAEIRNTALSISYNMATSIFGGTAPYIIESLVQNTGSITSSVYYIIITAIFSLVALYFYQDKSLREQKITID